MAEKVSHEKKTSVKQPKKTLTRLLQRTRHKHPEPYFLETMAPGELTGAKLKNADVPLPSINLGGSGPSS